MYLEFQLPTGAGGMAAAHANAILSRMLEAWSEKYDIPYRKKTEKYRVKVTFDDNKAYAVFALTWNPNKDQQWVSYFSNYSLIEPMKCVY